MRPLGTTARRTPPATSVLSTSGVVVASTTVVPVSGVSERRLVREAVPSVSSRPKGSVSPEPIHAPLSTVTRGPEHLSERVAAASRATTVVLLRRSPSDRALTVSGVGWSVSGTPGVAPRVVMRRSSSVCCGSVSVAVPSGWWATGAATGTTERR